MTEITILYSTFLLIGVFIGSISQVMLKKAAMREYASRIKEYFNPLVICAYVLFVGTTFLSIMAYKGIPLSMGPILEATSYIYVTAFGVGFFQERMNTIKILSLVIIILGIVIYSVWG